MKNLSLYLNVVLLLAVGILFYLHFSGGSEQIPKQVFRKSAALKDSGQGGMSIAYIEMDSLFEKIPFVRRKRKEFEAEQKSIESEWENGYRGLENQRNEFIKKGASITEDMAREFQDQWLRQKERIDMRKDEQVQQLSEKQYRFMGDFQDKLKGFLKDYNDQKQFSYIFSSGTGLDYLAYKDTALDITEDVVSGMKGLLEPGKK